MDLTFSSVMLNVLCLSNKHTHKPEAKPPLETRHPAHLQWSCKTQNLQRSPVFAESPADASSSEGWCNRASATATQRTATQDISTPKTIYKKKYIRIVSFFTCSLWSSRKETEAVMQSRICRTLDRWMWMRWPSLWMMILMMLSRLCSRPTGRAADGSVSATARSTAARHGPGHR